MKGNRLAVLAGATAAFLLASACPARADTTVYADLVQQNRSGVTGTVVLTASSAGDLRVRIRARGLVPGPHAQHLHGALEGGEFHCATTASDADGDGWLTNEEASGEYGSAFLALTTGGDTSGDSALDLARMPVADAKGRLRYDRTIPAAQIPDGLVSHLSHMHVVQHGIDANDNGRYDLDALGESTFAAGLGFAGVPEEATNPASCGVITGASATKTPPGGVATGGETSEGTQSLPLAVLGVGMLGLAAGIAWRRRAHKAADRR
jgi:hypothetical protein